MTKTFLPALAALLAAAPLLRAADLPVFPKQGTEKHVRGELVSADYIHRSGQFRAEDGTLTSFTLIPSGIMRYRGSEADMREVPLGAKLAFLLLPDAEGRLTRLITTQDDQPADPQQRQRFIDFTKARGVAGIIDKTEGRLVTITFFSGDPASFKKDFLPDLAKGKTVKLCVANDELRTWNPGVDGDGSYVEEVRSVPADGFGCSGVQVVLKTTNMLEGFRRGRVVRVFGSGWKVQDQFYGESLMGYGFSRMLNLELVENVAKEYPEQLPYRTDFGNAHLPWFQPKPGIVRLPEFSHHLVLAELVKVDAATRGGQYRIAGTDKTVDFTLLEKPVLKQLGHDAPLEALAIGQQHRFHTYQNDKGAFTRVSLITDSFTNLHANVTTARVKALSLDADAGTVDVGWQIAEVKDYNGDMKRPPDIGQTRLRVNAATRVWKGDSQAALKDLAIGDVLLLNLSGPEPLLCTDLWIGEDTHKQVIEKQRKIHTTAKMAKK